MLFRAGKAVAPEVIQGLAREMATFIASTAPVGDMVQRALQLEAARVLDAVPDFRSPGSGRHSIARSGDSPLDSTWRES